MGKRRGKTRTRISASERRQLVRYGEVVARHQWRWMALDGGLPSNPLVVAASFRASLARHDYEEGKSRRERIRIRAARWYAVRLLEKLAVAP